MPKPITSTTYGSMHISFARQNTVVNIYRTGLIPTLIPDPASPPSRSRLARESDWFFSLAIFLTRWFSAVAGFLPRTRARPDQFWISPSRAGFPDRQLQNSHQFCPSPERDLTTAIHSSGCSRPAWRLASWLDKVLDTQVTLRYAIIYTQNNLKLTCSHTHFWTKKNKKWILVRTSDINSCGSPKFLVEL